MINPFERAQVLFEAKTKLSGAIETLTKGKSRKYVKYSELKKHMGLDDNMFDEVVTSAQKSNRHSNKYVFTNVDDEPAIGVAASKRHAKSTPSSAPGQGLAHNVSTKADVVDMYDAGSGKDRVAATPGPIPATYMMKEHREREVWGIYNRHGWRGLDRLGLLPEGWQSMTGTKILESIIAKEFPINEDKCIHCGSSKVTNIKGDKFKCKNCGEEFNEREMDEGVVNLRVRALEKKFKFGGQTYLATGEPGSGYASFIKDENGKAVPFSKENVNIIRAASKLFFADAPEEEISEANYVEKKFKVDGKEFVAKMQPGKFPVEMWDAKTDEPIGLGVGGASAKWLMKAADALDVKLDEWLLDAADKLNARLNEAEGEEEETPEVAALREQFNELKRALKVTSYFNPDLHMRLFNLLKNKSTTTKMLMALPSWVVFRNMTDEAYMPPDPHTGNANDNFLAPEDFSRACLQLVITLVVLGKVDELTFMKANKMHIPKEVKDFMDQYEFSGIFLSDEHMIQNMLKYPSNVKFKFGTYATTLKNLELDWLDITI